MKATKFHISLGDSGVEATLRHMRRLVLESAEDPSVIGWAHDVVRFIPERNPDAAAQAFLNWVRAYMRYTEDPVEVESIKTPEAMIREYEAHGRTQGDCDDQSVLIASGLNAVGVETEFLVAAADPGYPDDFSHVLLQYKSPAAGWVSMDPIVRGTGLGWFPPRVSRVGTYRGGRLSGPARRNGGGGSVGVGTVAIVTVALVLWSRSRRAH